MSVSFNSITPSICIVFFGSAGSSKKSNNTFWVRDLATAMGRRMAIGTCPKHIAEPRLDGVRTPAIVLTPHADLNHDLRSDETPPPLKPSRQFTVTPDEQHTIRISPSGRSHEPRRRSKEVSSIDPVAPVPVTVWLKPETADAETSIARTAVRLGGELFIQQECVENLFEPWLHDEGWLY